MINVTLSTNGLGVRPYGGGDTPECHVADDISYSRYCGDFETDRGLVQLRLTRAQAIDLMDDLRSQIDYENRAQDEVNRLARSKFTEAVSSGRETWKAR